MRSSIFRPSRFFVSLFLAIVVTLGFVGDNTKVFAVDYDYYAGNDAIWYDPTYQTTCAAGGGALRGANTKEKIWNFFIANSLTPEQAAGLMGNIEKESTFIPVNWQAGESANLWDTATGKGWGLVQWDGGRRLDILETIREEKPHLEKYTEYKYQAIGEPNADFPQADFDEMLLFLLDFMMQESMQVRGLRDGFSSKGFDGGSPERDEKEWTRMKKQTTIENATLFWEWNFERSADTPSMLQERVRNAEKIYDEFKNNLSAAGTGTEGCAGADGLQELTLAYAWPEYHEPPYPTKKPAYAEAVQAAIDANDGLYVGTQESGYEGVDCGGFVTLLVTNSGHDPTYNYDGKGGNTTTQKQWLDANWEPVGVGGKETSTKLRPGDVAIAADGETNHTYIYVGEIEGFGGNGSTPGVASASISYTGESWRAPMAGGESLTNPTFTWYTKKG